MTSRARNLPPIAALRAFDAAATHLNFTAAAAELELTQGAISHQIRDLEARLGATLFKREARGIALTDAGKTYLGYVRESLARLREGAEALSPSVSDHVLTVSCSPNFAHKWLVPRMGSFVADYPELDLRLSASAQHITFDNDGIDIAIRHGDGHWPELAVTRLCEELLFPVCSPHLTPSMSTLTGLEDLRSFSLIHDEQREGWSEWLSSVGVDPESFDLERGPVFSQSSLAIDAAIAAQGIALARSALVALDLKAGRLLRPLEVQVPAKFAYWIVCPAENEKRTVIQSFKAWLLSQVESDSIE